MKLSLLGKFIDNTFNIYRRKRRWKWFLFFTALIIVFISLWFTNMLVRKIAADERERVKLWADAIQHKASLVNYTNAFFERVREEERKKVKLWAETNKKIISASLDEDLTFYLRIISDNTTIPVILTDKDDKIINAVNVNFNKDTIKYLQGKLKDEFTVFEPISMYGQYIYYKESKVYTDLRNVLDDLIKSFFTEIVNNSAAVPVIITDSTKCHVITYGNLDSSVIINSKLLKKTIDEMKSQNEPVAIEILNYGKQYIFYKNSFLLTQLKYYPYFQFLVIGLFIIIAYILFSIARRSEQNQVWVGMAKETAHQIGTPLSSLMAWMEILKMKNIDNEMTEEMQKDIKRLENITERFSKIGSPPVIQEENLVTVISDTIDYLKTRTSSKVAFNLKTINRKIILPLNKHLFEWVIENICKNSIDAMNGEGTIDIKIAIEGLNSSGVIIDISDTGKGLHKSNFKNIFHPGYTSKKRGWGLGLTLSRRIIEEYHKGKIYVKSSAIGKGTTIRIVLNK